MTLLKLAYFKKRSVTLLVTKKSFVCTALSSYLLLDVLRHLILLFMHVAIVQVLAPSVNGVLYRPLHLFSFSLEI